MCTHKPPNGATPLLRPAPRPTTGFLRGGRRDARTRDRPRGRPAAAAHSSLAQQAASATSTGCSKTPRPAQSKKCARPATRSYAASATCSPSSSAYEPPPRDYHRTYFHEPPGISLPPVAWSSRLLRSVGRKTEARDSEPLGRRGRRGAGCPHSDPRALMGAIAGVGREGIAVVIGHGRAHVTRRP